MLPLRTSYMNSFSMSFNCIHVNCCSIFQSKHKVLALAFKILSRVMSFCCLSSIIYFIKIYSGL